MRQKFLSYVDSSRWNSFFYQIKEVALFNPRSVLIIGALEDVAGTVLKANMNVEIEYFDIQSMQGVNYIGDIRNFSEIVQDRQWDVILCCQVLEHIPFEDFESVVKEMSLHSRKGVVISLPCAQKTKFHIKVIFENKKMVDYTRMSELYDKNHRWNKEIEGAGCHDWEIRIGKWSFEKIRNILNRYYIVRREYYVPENRYHYFFVLSKKHNS